MVSKLRFILIFFIYNSFSTQANSQDHPDTFLSIVQLIQKYGYPAEVHEITTEDGYILTIYRIPYGLNGNKVGNKPALLMHGIGGQAENFVINGMNNASLAYSMANSGYDVWIGNTRGTQHGRNHRVLDPNSAKFWDFSWHEIALYDLSATIDYILQNSTKERLHYVGHSQGGTIFFVLASLKPEYQNKIVLASLIGPAVYLRYFRHRFLEPFTHFRRELTILLKFFNIYEFPPNYFPIWQLLVNLCIDRSRRIICEYVYYTFADGKSGHFNKEMVLLAMRFVPSFAVKQSLHFVQVRETGHFRPWDYGVRKNMRIYGKSTPPDYPIKNITVPVAIYHSLGDTFVSPEDTDDLCKILRKCVRNFLLPYPEWNHYDYLLGDISEREVNRPLIEFAKNY